MPPKMICEPALVGLSDIFVDIAAKLLQCLGVGTNIELAFVNGEDGRIAIYQFAFTHVPSTEASVLRNISGRILVKGGFVGHGAEMVDRTTVTALNCRVAFDGLMTCKVGNCIVSLQNYSVGVNVLLGLPGGLGSFLCQDDHASFFIYFSNPDGLARRVRERRS